MKTLKNNLIYFCLSVWMGIGIISCDDDDSMPTETEVTLDVSAMTLKVGSQIELTPRFGNVIPQKSYVWSVSDESIVSIEAGENYKATVTGLNEGTTTVTISSNDNTLQATTIINTYLIRETQVSLENNITAYTQSQTTLTPEFNNVDFPVRDYTWTAEPAGMLDFTVDPITQAITMQGIMAGSATLTFASTDGAISASTFVNILDENDGILKILAIGNSFSEDALESYLWEIADAAGKDIMIGNMYIGGANLDTHIDKANSDAADYSYRKIDLNGNHTTTAGVSLSSAVQDENWDYISFQQASYDSGIFSTYAPLPELYEKVKSWDTNEYTKYVLHRTWAYAQNSTHSGFANYDNDQMTMFDAIVDAYNQADDLIPTTFVTPAGTAIQNGRTSYLGDGFTRDGYHLNDLGKYIASCTWFEMLFGESVIGNTFVPDGFLDFDVELGQQAAHEAVNNPQMITELTDFQDPGGSGVLTQPVLINFSSTTNPDGWNAYSSHLEDAGIPNLLDSQGTFTGVGAITTARFRGINNTSGEAITTTDFNMPETVSQSNFYCNGRDWGNNPPIDESVIEFSGFTSNATYEFCFFGSRGSVGDNRETKYTVIGASEQSATLDASQNNANLACITGVQADTDGKITLKISMGDNNSSTNGFYYLNAMRIQPN